MSVVFKFKGDASGVIRELGKVRGGIEAAAGEMGRMSWAEFSVGLSSALNLLGQAKDALRGLVGAVVSPAAALEEVGVKLGVMFGSRVKGDALAESLQRLATNGVVPLQELESAAAALIGKFKDPHVVAEWVERFADIAAGSKMTAARFGEMVARLDDMGKAEFTELANAGIPIYQAMAEVMGVSVEEVQKLGKEGKVSADVLLESFKRLTDAGGKFHGLNAELSNTTAGSWETLKASIDEVLAEVGKPLNDAVRPVLQDIAGFLQKYKEQIAELLKVGLRFSSVWMGFKAFDFAAQLYKCVAAFVAMNAQAKGLRAVFQSIGRVGWMLLLTGAVETLMRIREAWKGDVEAEEAERESAEEAERERKHAAIERKYEADEAQRVRWVAHSERVMGLKGEFDEKLEPLNEGRVASMEEWDRRREGLNELGRWLEKNENEGDFERERERLRDAERRHAALRTEVEKLDAERREKERLAAQREELERRERNRREAGYEAKTAAKIEAFKGADDFVREKTLEFKFKALGLQWYADKSMRDVVLSRALREAATANDMGRYNKLVHVGRWVEAHEERQSEEAELGSVREEMLRQLMWERRRAELVRKGDVAGVERMDVERDFLNERADLMAAGLSEREAGFYAAERVARKQDERRDGARVQVVSSSLAAVGGGGVAHRLGDAQLNVSKKQLSEQKKMREFLSAINKKLTGTGIPVVL